MSSMTTSLGRLYGKTNITNSGGKRFSDLIRLIEL
jgi:hypothetical protein